MAHINNDRSSSKVVLITGASSGIGKACAEYLHELGYRVYGTSRNEIGNLTTGTFMLIRMDVNNDQSVADGIDLILSREGRIDAVINNAGIGISGSVEDTALDEAKAQFETNFFGVLRVCRNVLPVMRSQGGGRIINIGSVAGVIGVPFNGIYSASKFALAGLSEALRIEVKPHGIHVTLVEPGDINTSMSSRSPETRESATNSIYRGNHSTTREIMARDEDEGPPPSVVAFLVANILKMTTPCSRYRVGPFMEKVAVLLKVVLPATIFEWLLMKYYKL